MSTGRAKSSGAGAMRSLSGVRLSSPSRPLKSVGRPPPSGPDGTKAEEEWEEPVPESHRRFFPSSSASSVCITIIITISVTIVVRSGCAYGGGLADAGGAPGDGPEGGGEVGGVAGDGVGALPRPLLPLPAPEDAGFAAHAVVAAKWSCMRWESRGGRRGESTERSGISMKRIRHSFALNSLSLPLSMETCIACKGEALPTSPA